ncbi:MAG: histidinol dehydrogenase, partial [Prevotella sp.]|nr:histidinol dehydrogenase [Prevotella sp.]
MNTILYPNREKWAEILQRPAVNPFELEETCKTICEEIIKHGDDILRKYTWYFDRVKLNDIEVPEEEIQES